ncbi:MAG: hypothetical protein Q7U78_12265 [Gallionella sp.]|nr:hypothetical protein [Gallionella sp.]
MNIYANTINTIELTVAIAFLVWFFYGPWNRFVIDLARQNLFELRDEVFLLAADNKLEFSSDIYCLLRERLNKMIRFCHHMTLANLIATRPAAKSNQASRDVLTLIRAIPDRELARKLEKNYIYALIIMLGAMFLRSFALILPFVLLLPIAIVLELLKGVGKSNPIVTKVRHAVERDIDLESAVRCS